MSFNLYQLYQMTGEEANQSLIFQSYERLASQSTCVTVDRYEKVCEGLLPENASVFDVRRLLEKKPRTILTRHSLSVSDVIVIVKGKELTCYYVDDPGMVPLKNFFPRMDTRKAAKPLTPETTSYSIPGKPGLWAVSDTILVEGHTFFLMESEKYGRRVNRVLLDDVGNIVMHENFNDFDPETLNTIQEYLLPIIPQNLTNDGIQGGLQDHRPSFIKSKPSQRRSIRQRLKEKERIVHSMQTQVSQTSPAQ